MYKIKTLNKISSAGLNALNKSEYEVGDNVSSPDGIVLRSFNMHDMELPDTLKAVARAGAGTNNIPIDKCSQKGVVVFNTPGANANAVKEIVLTGLLLSSRKIIDGIQWVKTLDGKEDIPKLVEKGKGEFVGPEIQGKKLGVIGLGAVGVLVANAANALGMKVLGYDPYLSVDAAWHLSSSINRAVNLETLFSSCDYVTVHIPLTDDTKHMFNKSVFDIMNKGARLLNFSRGELVDNAALKEALDNGTVSCYITDFPNEETIKMKNTICIPHLGASTPESEENCAVMAVEEIKEFLETGNIKNSVNFPNCSLAVADKSRVAVAHKNIPNILSPITNVFASKSINIIDMINKSKKNLAYTILNVDSVDDEIIQKLNSVEGILSSRIIKRV